MSIEDIISRGKQCYNSKSQYSQCADIDQLPPQQVGLANTFIPQNCSNVSVIHNVSLDAHQDNSDSTVSLKSQIGQLSGEFELKDMQFSQDIIIQQNQELDDLPLQVSALNFQNEEVIFMEDLKFRKIHLLDKYKVNTTDLEYYSYIKTQIEQVLGKPIQTIEQGVRLLVKTISQKQ
ncbi:hypothetical protein SS50377_21783 [Spironucleus salmonicida]|uniref:Uncharacterized protein n=1 Tax=Spironucleus salmonicida TaxID=348837 RepID=V6LMM5_9EUKA|nr:hypothetical protein SS50377_21783 [Spironucleus salmonicida]|eukprot:EST45468.1 Hypothetical protein SS50377_14622 [Spironucleus salmonicida]